MLYKAKQMNGEFDFENSKPIAKGEPMRKIFGTRDTGDPIDRDIDSKFYAS